MAINRNREYISSRCIFFTFRCINLTLLTNNAKLCIYERISEKFIQKQKKYTVRSQSAKVTAQATTLHFFGRYASQRYRFLFGFSSFALTVLYACSFR